MSEDRKHILIATKEAVDGQFLHALLAGVGLFKVATAQSAAQVIQGLRRSPDLILADPGIPGNFTRAVELMRRMPKLNHVGIVAVTAERQALSGLKSKGYNAAILKPFTPPGVLASVWKILEAAPPLPGDGGPAKLDIEVGAIDGLPTLPTVYTRVQELCKDPDVNADALSQAIETDPAITVKLLRLANSAFFGFNRKITSVQDAVSLLGNQTVQNAVLSISVFESTRDVGADGGLDRKEFWRHSAACGSIVRSIARRKQIDREDAFTAGILHDIGKVVLDGLYGEFYATVLQTVAQQNVSISQAEESALGTSHAALGEELAVSWDIPPGLVQAISHHHRPERADLDAELACLVHVGDALARNLGVGSGGDPLVPVINPFAYKQLSVDPEELAGWEPEMLEEVNKDLSFLSAIA
jgi:putative nucleotidyltransferase with HDIG domain